MISNIYDRINDYGSVKISLAGPNDIRSWSFGEVRKPALVAYRMSGEVGVPSHTVQCARQW